MNTADNTEYGIQIIIKYDLKIKSETEVYKWSKSNLIVWFIFSDLGFGFTPLHNKT